MRGTLEIHLVMLLRMYFSGSRIQVASCRLLSQKLRKICLHMVISAQKTAWYVGLYAMILNLDVEWCFVRLQIRYAEDLYVVNQSCCLLIIELQLMPILTFRDINIISIERLLHCLLSGKLCKFYSSTLFFKFVAAMVYHTANSP